MSNIFYIQSSEDNMIHVVIIILRKRFDMCMYWYISKMKKMKWFSHVVPLQHKWMSITWGNALIETMEKNFDLWNWIYTEYRYENWYVDSSMQSSICMFNKIWSLKKVFISFGQLHLEVHRKLIQYFWSNLNFI